MLLLFCQTAFPADERFPITRVQVKGNSLLPALEVDRVVSAAIGPDKSYADIQRAIEALEAAYRRAGYSAVQVQLPEQELTGGVVSIVVSETRIGAVTVSGNKYFDEANVRASLRTLQSGQTPNLRSLSAAIQLANDNPSKQVEVVLASGATEDIVDAKIKVVDSRPLRVTLTADNTGTASSGRIRTGVSLQHTNLFNRDNAGTVAYTTSSDSPGGVHVNLWSVGYRIPLYAIGDSIDLLYGYSSVNTPGSTPTLGGPLGLIGKGNVASLRFNHFFAREGSFTSKLIFTVDRKYINSRCNVNGAEVSFAPPTPAISSCVPYTVIPLGVTYVGHTQRDNRLLDWNIGLARNIPTGERYTNTSGRSDRYSYLTPGNRDTRDGFMTLRGGASMFQSFANDWQLRLATNAQVASDPLVASEQFGLVGAGAVRGFDERVVAADAGVLVNAELYGPELAARYGVSGNLRLLGFIDAGRGMNLRTGGTATPSGVTVASVGTGARYSLERNVDLHLDAARVISAPSSGTNGRGHWKAHLGMSIGF
ncbi:MAG: ShlB/FhaC/HecB family hemolysin secretion/activation protein [Rhodoferax sp.]|nr:ShlB/FhaC/HecB family hemolysin secretion/activation protein [Rhodoferax sp.]